MSLVFELETTKLTLKLRITGVDEVLIHEEIIPELLDELTRDIKQSGVVKDPVVVDERTRVVLDGMHRVAALREMGCAYLPICGVDYQNPSIKIGCWYRVVKGKNGEKFRGILRLLGLESQSCPPQEAQKALARRKALTAFLTPQECILVKSKKMGILELYTWIKRIERALRKEGFKLRYECEKDAQRLVGSSAAVLMVPRVTKREVIEITSAGRVFAHKTTRHIIPARPLNLQVPLDWLRGNVPLREVNRMLRDSLKTRKVERLPPGSVHENRCYEEEVLIFR
jgi:hypothetical protein